MDGRDHLRAGARDRGGEAIAGVLTGRVDTRLLLAPALLLQAALHLGSLFAGDDLGSPTRLPMGQWIRGDRGYHPVALYATVLSVLAAALTYGYLREQPRTGEVLGLGLALAALSQFFVDQWRPDYVLPDTFFGHVLRVDQAVLIALTAAGMAFFFKRERHNAK